MAAERDALVDVVEAWSESLMAIAQRAATEHHHILAIMIAGTINDAAMEAGAGSRRTTILSSLDMTALRACTVQVP